jgi:hypothetical protein
MYNQVYDITRAIKTWLWFVFLDFDIAMPAIIRKTGIRTNPKILIKIQFDSPAKPNDMRDNWE